MFLRKTIQGTVIYLMIGTLNFALAGSLQEWEGAFDEDNNEAPEGLVDQTTVPDEVEVFVDVAATSKVDTLRLAQNHVKNKSKELAMIQVPSSGGKGMIVDDTATTGENAKKRLPLAVKQQMNLSSNVHDIKQVIPHIVVMDAYTGNHDQ